MTVRPGGARWAVAVVIAVLAIVAGPARPVSAACTCTATTAEQGMRDASEVFYGSLTDISAPVDGLVTMSFDVRLVYKGEVGATTTANTFASAEECGFGETARRGDWLVFAYAMPGGGDDPPLLVSCSPSTPVASGSQLPIELGQGRAPPDAEAQTPVPVNSAPTWFGSVTDPRDTWRAVLAAVALTIVIGVVARILAGSRRTVVR